MTAVDPLTLELVADRLDEAVREMQRAIFRTGYSTIIRETKDTSAGLTTADGRIVGQQFRHPLHLGVFSPTVDAVYEYFSPDSIEPGDVFLANDPYVGGTPHANDIIVARPVFAGGELRAFALNIAHKPDLGGLVPGTSSGAARELYHEGLLLPPVRVQIGGEPNEDVRSVIRNNSRLPDVTMGDLDGQIGCTRIGDQKLGGIFEEFGAGVVESCFDRLLDDAASRLRDSISGWPEERATATIELETPSDQERWSADLDEDDIVSLELAVECEGDRVTFDFTGSDDQVDYPVNLRPNIVAAVCNYAVLGLSGADVSGNGGVTRVTEVRTRPGSILDPRRPAPVNQYGYSVITVTRLVFRALSKLLPETAVADQGGSVGITLGGEEVDGVQYESLFSAYGATTTGDGATGVSPHMINASITPIEIVESEFPTTVDRFQIPEDSAGAGEFRGGSGIRREYTVDAPIEFTYRPATSNVFPPQGVDGGEGPADGAKCVIEDDGERRRLPAISGPRSLSAGARIRIEIPGGGGVGDPSRRDSEAVLTDYRNGHLSAQRAADVYGVDIDGDDETD